MTVQYVLAHYRKFQISHIIKHSISTWELLIFFLFTYEEYIQALRSLQNLVVTKRVDYKKQLESGIYPSCAAASFMTAGLE